MLSKMPSFNLHAYLFARPCHSLIIHEVSDWFLKSELGTLEHHVIILNCYQVIRSFTRFVTKFT